jgi:hypothetical protein
MAKKQGWSAQRKLDGLKVVDATEDLELRILPKDVKASKKKDPENCAAAVACKRTYHRDVKVFMSRMYVKDSKHKRWIRYIVPEAVAREIVAFDRGSEFMADNYLFKAPSENSRLGHYHSGKTKNRPPSSRRRAPMHFTTNVRPRGKW